MSIDPRIGDIRLLARVIGNLVYEHQCELQRKNASGETYCAVGEYFRGSAPFSCNYLGDEDIPFTIDSLPSEVTERLAKIAKEEGASPWLSELIAEHPSEIELKMKHRCNYVPEHEGYKFRDNITKL